MKRLFLLFDMDLITIIVINFYSTKLTKSISLSQFENSGGGRGVGIAEQSAITQFSQFYIDMKFV